MRAQKYLSLGMALVLLTSVCGVGWANNGYGSGLQLSQSPNTYSTQQPAVDTRINPDDFALRGHLTTIPKGTILMVKMDHPLSSYSSKVGDAITALVEADVYLDNQIIVPMGSQVEGAVTGVTSAGHLGKHGAIEMQFHSIRTPQGALIPFRAHVVTDDGTGVLKANTDQARVFQSLGVAAGGAAAGTIAGLAAGSILGSAATGATVGLAAGSVAGIGYAIVREGKQMVIPSGARMSIIVDQPVAVN